MFPKYLCTVLHMKYPINQDIYFYFGWHESQLKKMQYDFSYEYLLTNRTWKTVYLNFASS